MQPSNFRQCFVYLCITLFGRTLVIIQNKLLLILLNQSIFVSSTGPTLPHLDCIKSNTTFPSFHSFKTVLTFQATQFSILLDHQTRHVKNVQEQKSQQGLAQTFSSLKHESDSFRHWIQFSFLHTLQSAAFFHLDLNEFPQTHLLCLFFVSVSSFQSA
jgi:hypothetical protein